MSGLKKWEKVRKREKKREFKLNNIKNKKKLDIYKEKNMCYYELYRVKCMNIDFFLKKCYNLYISVGKGGFYYVKKIY